jgi:elongation factor P
MAVINSNDLKPGTVFVDGTETFIVLKYGHMKKGRGQATIRVKVKNLKTNSLTEKTYTNEQKVEVADVDKRTAQYMYADEKKAYFMDTGDYSQFSLLVEQIKYKLRFLKEGDSVITMFLEQKPISIEIPKTVVLEVVETNNAVAGNTAGTATKQAKVETGYSLQIPMFIDKGARIKINTDSGEYVSRVS